MHQVDSVVSINVDLIVPSKYQPRKIFDEDTINELSESIKEYGILNPILIRSIEDGKYEIIAGERRFRAAKKAGLTEIPAIIKNVDEELIPQMALIENLQRENISPLEEAKTYHKILQNSNLTEEKLSKLVGKSQSFISNKLRLLTLPKDVQKALFNKEISERHARSLLTVKNEEKQTELLSRIISEKLTVKELDNIIKENQISGSNIESPINEIIDTLKNDNKKEEKESDNMNNGNFFPGFNQSVNNQNEGFNYNPNQNVEAPLPPVIEEMNPQPMPQNISMQEQAMVAPPLMPNPMEIPTVPPVPNAPVNMTPPMPEPIMENTVAPTPTEMPTVPPVPEPVELNPYNQDINNAIPNFDVPIAPSAPMMDPPLFTGPIQETPVIPESSPVIPEATLAPMPEVTMEEAKEEEKEGFEAVKELLTQNGVIYKAYSNETGHCIIIEF